MVVRNEVRQLEQVAVVDPIWGSLLNEARSAASQDPFLAAFFYSTVLNHPSLEASVIYRICELLDHPDMQAVLLRQTFDEMLKDWPEWGTILRVDIQAVYDRDPACTRFMEPVLYFKGFHAIQTHRLAHWLLKKGRKDFALYLQSRASVVFQTDINPAAQIGRGIFLDHATGLVVGETAVIGDNVSILHGVTLGGRQHGDVGARLGQRHRDMRGDEGGSGTPLEAVGYDDGHQIFPCEPRSDKWRSMARTSCCCAPPRRSAGMLAAGPLP